MTGVILVLAVMAIILGSRGRRGAARSRPAGQVSREPDRGDGKGFPFPSGLERIRGGTLSFLLEQIIRHPEVALDVDAWQRPMLPGERVGRFEILREIGRGAFGVVYEARDMKLRRRVALKMLRPGRPLDEVATAKLRQEARAMAMLTQPGIVTIFDAGVCDNGFYLVMELLEGKSLQDRLAEGQMPVREALDIALQVAEALAHVHARGVVHRDVKPGNIFLCSDGSARLLDLGLAHMLCTDTVGIGGTPAYAAPEQFRGEPIDGKADVFALGAVLFEMLSGTRRHPNDGRARVMEHDSPPRLGQRESDKIARLVDRCLAFNPRERPSSADVSSELRAALLEQGGSENLPGYKAIWVRREDWRGARELLARHFMGILPPQEQLPADARGAGSGEQRPRADEGVMLVALDGESSNSPSAEATAPSALPMMQLRDFWVPAGVVLVLAALVAIEVGRSRTRFGDTDFLDWVTVLAVAATLGVVFRAVHRVLFNASRR